MKNTKNPPGQYKSREEQYLCDKPGQVKLQDYLEQKYPEEMKKKLTFEEWWNQQVEKTGYTDPWQDSKAAAQDAWNAAQENK